LTWLTRLAEHRDSMLPASVPVDLTWNAPAECPSRDAVVDEVARVLTASKGQRVKVTADVDVSRDGQGRWHAALRVVTGDARGDRTLDAESCPAIASATAVIVAVAVEGGMPEPALPEAPPPSKSTPPATAAAPQHASQLIVGAAGVADGGMFWSLALGVEGALGWAYSWSKWRLRGTATGSFYPPRDSPLSANSEALVASGRFQLFATAARVCGSVAQGAFDLGPCLGLEVDVMTGTANPPARATRDSGIWATALGSLLASWNFSRHFAIFLRVEGFYTPSPPPRFRVTVKSPPSYIDVYQPSQIGARGALGLEVRFF
jgi:hypothetical protein